MSIDASPKTTVGMLNMSIDRTNEVLELQKQGLDPQTIASKLGMTVSEVESAIFSQVQNSPQYDSWAIECMHWGGAHY
jgi:DNA-binding NarL/FixJ family response regulator